MSAPLDDAPGPARPTPRAEDAAASYPLRSLDARLLYAEGGFPDLTTALAPLLEIPPAAERVATLFPAYEYTRPEPRGLATGDAAFRESLAWDRTVTNRNRRRGPPSVLFALRDAAVRDSVVYGRDGGDDFVVFETYRDSDRPTATLAAPAELAAAAPADGPEVTLFLGSSGSFNYGHWLVDDLPRLEAFHVVRRLHPGRRINLVLVGYNPLIDFVRTRSIALVLGDRDDYEITLLSRLETRRYRTLYYASPVTIHPTAKSPEALARLAARLRRRTWRLRLGLHGARLRERLGAHGPLAGTLVPRLYVDRPAWHGRRLLNRDAVLAHLVRRGFEVIDPEQTTFGRQVATFAQAGIVVGGMGAAMTTTLFCRRGTPIVHLAPDGWVEPFFWDLATVRGHRYHALYGPAQGDEPPHLRPFTIDLAELDAGIDRALRDRGD